MWWPILGLVNRSRDVMVKSWTIQSELRLGCPNLGLSNQSRAVMVQSCTIQSEQICDSPILDNPIRAEMWWNNLGPANQSQDVMVQSWTIQSEPRLVWSNLGQSNQSQDGMVQSWTIHIQSEPRCDGSIMEYPIRAEMWCSYLGLSVSNQSRYVMV